MDSVQLFLNDRLVSITANASLVQQLKTDDTFLSDYIVKAVKSNQFSFVTEDDLDKLTVKRAIVTKVASGSSLIPVWYRKGKPTDDDANATALLIELRTSPKYATKFNDKKAVRLRLWEDISFEMKEAGYEVDATKCQQKFLNLTKSYVKFIKRSVNNENGGDLRPPDHFDQLSLIMQDKIEGILNEDLGKIELEKLGDESTVEEIATDSDNNEEINQPVRKKPRIDSVNGDVPPPTVQQGGSIDVKKHLNDPQLERICQLLEEKNKLMKERNLQNAKLVQIFQKLVDKFQ